MKNSSNLQSLVDEAIRISSEGHSDRALQLLAEASAQEPAAAIPHLLMAAELAQLGRFDEAEEAYSVALINDANLKIARYQLGLLQFTRGRVASALLTWQPLLDGNLNDPLVAFVEGFVALAKDDFEVALQKFQIGQASNISNAPLNTDIGKVISRIRSLLADQENVPVESVSTTQSIDPDEVESHILISSYLRQNILH